MSGNFTYRITIPTELFNLSDTVANDNSFRLSGNGCFTATDPDLVSWLNIIEPDYSSECADADSDGDGLPDSYEAENGLDPNNPADAMLDVDSDGLNALEEFQQSTNPQVADSDGDGMPDGYEVAANTDPLADDAAGDADGDGVSNLQEYLDSRIRAGIAQQSSTAYSGDAGRAFDGNTNGVYNQQSVTHTARERQPWWQVELDERADIDNIVLHNRTDCCTARLSDVHVFVSDHPFGRQSLDELLGQPGIAHVYLPGAQPAEVEIPIDATGRYVRVQLAGTNFLSLAEVVVTGDTNTQVPPAAPAIKLAPYGAAAQSSTAYSGFAVRAIDQNISGTYSQQSVTHTRSQSEPWWEVALQAPADLERIVLYNRSDCCTGRLNNVHIFLSQEPFGNRTLTDLLADGNIEQIYLDGVQGAETEIPLDNRARYVRVQLAGSGFLSLAEVQVFGLADEIPPPSDSAANLAPVGSASQSSTRYGGVAGRAIDDNTASNYPAGSVTHTASEPQPWWQVDLGSRADVQQIVLYNRTDCCAARLSNVHVFISEHPFVDQSLDELLDQDSIAHYYLPGSVGQQVELPVSATGRYVRVQLAGSGFLSLAEVQVIGDPNSDPSPPPPSTNIAPLGSASQSSTAYNGVATRAIDRKSNGIYSQGSVTHTVNQAQPWWQVALPASAALDRVVIFNREDCCASRLRDVNVFVSDSPFGNQTMEQIQARSDVEHRLFDGIQGQQFEMSLDLDGQYVRVQLEGSGFLSLAEVRVMGAVQ